MEEKDISIFSLPITPRAQKSLFLHGIKTLADLRQLSESELEQIPDVGAKSVKQITLALAQFTLSDWELAEE